jgi:hypothetical protein
LGIYNNNPFRLLGVRRSALADIKQGLRDADLLQLAPGQAADQSSTWVLLRGSLRTTGHASSIPAAASGMRRLT